MFNHGGEKRNCDWGWKEEQQGFAMTAIRDIKRGEQILLSYGQEKNNILLLQSYGFTLNDNPADIFQLFVPIMPHDPMAKQKMDYIGSTGSYYDLNAHLENFYGRKIPEFFAFVRFVVFKGENLSLFKEDNYQWKFGILSLENEKAMFHYIEELCEYMLRRFPDSLERDHDLLASG